MLRERTNARHLTPSDLEETPDLAVMDVSFISILKILPALGTILAPGGDLVSLVKPQFEAGRADVGRGGLVKDPSVHARVMNTVCDGAGALGFEVRAVCRSPIEGSSGNREFFLHALCRPTGKPETVTPGGSV